MDERTYLLGAVASAALVAVLVLQHRHQPGPRHASVLARIVLLISTALLFIDQLSVFIGQ
jgi:hypothetical protein